ncbi:type III pantothenate kinase [Flavobacteriaceae bacterium F08102]|nr:type III pantothenate kinase [Flavobacteriaceae bacterium F08102]
MNLILDIGNTHAKIAVFQNRKLVSHQQTFPKNLNTALRATLNNYPIQASIVSTVSAINKDSLTSLHKLPKLISLDANTKVPFINQYATPTTLGVDRIALVSAAVDQFPDRNVLVIDAGTCVTYDFVTNEKIYLGGAISPGIQIRYKALHDYTANLPLLQIDEVELTGNSTEKSIHSGVLNGIVQEINGVIEQYSHKYPNLTVVLTGGDAIFLAKMLKSSIFATPNFLLEGLNRILIHNLDE